ncbi:hypothetical protein Ddye_019950 [Dipteronia dyeriana]|uniref:Reverse transcriptase domain-containing protein n=1 Tax=Dipteronia dyeriana TaxID=168575 RepID=A0AAD9TZV3_9ROSI|nr:hypothetical protein Ddye_019950 [Dipteronia dyeriana]
MIVEGCVDDSDSKDRAVFNSNGPAESSFNESIIREWVEVMKWDVKAPVNSVWISSSLGIRLGDSSNSAFVVADCINPNSISKNGRVELSNFLLDKRSLDDVENAKWKKQDKMFNDNRKSGGFSGIVNDSSRSDRDLGSDDSDSLSSEENVVVQHQLFPKYVGVTLGYFSGGGSDKPLGSERVNSGSWKLSEEVAKVIETRVALGFDFHGNEGQAVVEISKKEDEARMWIGVPNRSIFYGWLEDKKLMKGARSSWAKCVDVVSVGSRIMLKVKAIKHHFKSYLKNRKVEGNKIKSSEKELVLAKILANRIRHVLNSVIGPTHMTFVKDRQILDSFVVAEEVIHSWKRDGKGGPLVKLDFKKAYDSVDHDFLIEVLAKMGFGVRWHE